MKSPKRKMLVNIRDYAGILFGSIIFGISYSWFLIPFKVAPGGVGGIAQVIYYFLGIPAGISMLIINVPLFVVAWFFLGKQFGVKSFFGMFMGSILIDLMSPELLYKNFPILRDFINTQYWAFTDSVLLASIAGSVLLGFSLGIIFKFRGSTGGTDIPVAMLKQYSGVSIGTGYWIIETLIIFAIGVAFKDLNLIIWGYLNLFITTQIVDLTAEGVPYTKGAYIMSKSEDMIKERIITELDRGITLFHSEGGYSGEKQNVLFVVVNRRQITSLRRLVKEEDPKAFMVLVDVNDVMGDGFKTRSLDFNQ
ncbi:MAG: YitT family protein [Ignavibacteriota bacterium]|nr:YitT family protein [Ignavibacteriota bacterium]